MTKRVIIGCLSAIAIAAAAGSSLAMEEQRLPTGPTGAPSAAAAPSGPVAPGVSVPGISVQAAPAASSSDGGTEIRIPGFGKLGTLPKMDFGLDLLYGATDTRAQQDPMPESDDLTIRGSVKHRF